MLLKEPCTETLGSEAVNHSKEHSGTEARSSAGWARLQGMLETVNIQKLCKLIVNILAS